VSEKKMYKLPSSREKKHYGNVAKFDGLKLKEILSLIKVNNLFST
jgi:hypothetical protein